MPVCVGAPGVCVCGYWVCVCGHQVCGHQDLAWADLACRAEAGLSEQVGRELSSAPLPGRWRSAVGWILCFLECRAHLRTCSGIDTVYKNVSSIFPGLILSGGKLI